jgi:small subunit ribosomal protein S11
METYRLETGIENGIWQKQRQPAGTGAPEKKGKKKKFKKKERKHVSHGVVHIQASFNNTIVTITDPAGNVISWKSSGSLGFRGSRKGTPFAAQQAAMNAANLARDHGVRSVEVRVSGTGFGTRIGDSRIGAAGIEVRTIKDVDSGSAQRLPSAEAPQSVD